VATNLDEQNRLDQTATSGGESGNTKGNTSTDSRSDSGRTGRGRGTGRGTGSTEEKLPKLAPLSEPKPVTVDIPGESPEEKKARNAAKQKAYRERKKAEKETGAKKPAVKKATASKKSPVLDSSSVHVKAMLSALFGVVASREGMEVWALSEAEIDSIVNPLTNMMAKNDAVGQALEQHGDAVALVMAVTVIALPRVLMMQQMKKLKAPTVTLPSTVRKGEKNGTDRTQPRTESNSQGTPGSGNGSNPKESTPTHSVYGESVSSHLSALSY